MEEYHKKLTIVIPESPAPEQNEGDVTHIQVESGENMIFLKYIFDFVFHWKGIYYGQLYYKTCLGILISPPKPQKTAKNVDFGKFKNYSF